MRHEAKSACHFHIPSSGKGMLKEKSPNGLSSFNHSEQGHFYHVNVVTNPSDSNCVVFFFCPKLSVWT